MKNDNETKVVNDLTKIFICPYCKEELKKNKELICSNCKRNFHITDNIPQFTDIDEFYEEKFIKPFRASIISKIYAMLLNPRLQYTNKVLGKDKNKNVKILDLGCGGGNYFFKKENSEVYGIDLSVTALKSAKTIYDYVAQADAKHLPFEGNHFDYILSWDLFGHIPFEEKDSVLKEIRRVMKNKAKIGMFIETDQQNDIYTFAKRYPELYQKYFIEQDGHIGLESSTKVIERFEKNGFKIIFAKPLYTNLFIPTAEYIKRFNNEYKEKSTKLKFFINLFVFLKKLKLNYPISFLIEFVGRKLDGFSKLDDGPIFLCCEKTNQ